MLWNHHHLLVLRIHGDWLHRHCQKNGVEPISKMGNVIRIGIMELEELKNTKWWIWNDIQLPVRIQCIYEINILSELKQEYQWKFKISIYVNFIYILNRESYPNYIIIFLEFESNTFLMLNKLIYKFRYRFNQMKLQFKLKTL